MMTLPAGDLNPMTLPLTKLPIGIQTFREIIEEGYAYVDKTDHALALASTGKNYFLSRPRRFGKSLFLDTLQELFEGSEPLFRGLYIHDRWDWSISCCSSARIANFATTGSRPAAPASSSSCSSNAAPSCPTWRASRPAKRSSTPSTSSASTR
jgi:hypothetical protein